MKLKMSLLLIRLLGYYALELEPKHHAVAKIADAVAAVPGAAIKQAAIAQDNGSGELAIAAAYEAREHLLGPYAT